MKKKHESHVFAVASGFTSDNLPFEAEDEFLAEKAKGGERLVKSSEIAPFHFDPAYILENKIPEQVEGSLSSDYLDDLEPSVAIDAVTVQGVPLLDYLDMYFVDSDPPSLADGIPVTQYVQGMSYDRIYPIVGDGSASESSRKCTGMRQGLGYYDARMEYRRYCLENRRFSGTGQEKPTKIRKRLLAHIRTVGHSMSDAA